MSVIEAFSGSGVFGNTSSSSSISATLTGNTGITTENINENDGSEIIFNLCDHFHDVVGSGNATKVSSSQTQTLSNNVLKRTYTFSFDLDFVANNLDVQDE